MLKLNFTENPVRNKVVPKEAGSTRHALAAGDFDIPLRPTIPPLGQMGVLLPVQRAPAAEQFYRFCLDPVRLFWCCQLTDQPLPEKNSHVRSAL